MVAIEITESVALQDPEAAQTILTRCREMGLRVVLDDFGTYYSSLSYLKKLPVDVIKLDRSFVRGLPDSRDDAAIARSVIALGISLGREMIAEGVETLEQAHWLVKHGCAIGQGYLFGRPMPAEEFALWRMGRSPT
jgi:EAL domain-containing protein (putative c-di-GMP-specific phosphodiesterase class I)